MPKGLPNDLGKWMAQVERKLDNLSSGNRLDHASLDGTTLYLKGDGQLGRIGRQPDGSNGVHVVKVQPPPQLTAPILTVGEQAGTCLVEWDGGTFDGRRMPLIHGHTEIWAELVGEDWSPTVAPGDAAKRVGTIRDRTGGEVVVALPQAGTWAVWLRAMGADRETAGPWSPVSQVEIVPLVDTGAIEAELEDARDRLEAAEAKAADAMQRVADLGEQWDEVDFPALQQELDDAKQAVADAESRLDTAEQNVSDAQDGLNHLRDVRLPQMRQDIEDEIDQHADRLNAFESEWNENWDPEAMDDLRGRQDTLEGDLVTGLDDVYRDAQAYAEAQADDAVNRAAADAQTEYDRLQELAERALSRAGDNVLEDPSFETDYWFDHFGGISRIEGPSHVARTGDQAMPIYAGSGALQNFNLDTVDVEPDDSWRFSLWYRAVDGDEPNLDRSSGSRLRIRDGSTNDILETSSLLEIEEGEYRRAVVTFTVPEGVTSLTAVLFVTHDTGTLIIDDIAFQEVGAAAEALRLAEVARQQAEAAHTAAGNAVDTAANAYDAASSKNSIHWSLSAPSGTADSTDDVWWQYELRNGRRVVTGQWFWDNGVWRETEIAEEWLPLVNVGTGTYGTFTGDRLEAHTVRTEHQLIGPRNIITDPEFETLDNDDFRSWRDTSGAWYLSTVAWSNRPFARLDSADSESSANQILTYGGNGPGNSVIPCEPGDVFKVRFQVLRILTRPEDTWRAQIRWSTPDGTGISWSTHEFGDYSNQSWVEFEAEAPEGATRFYLRFIKVGSSESARGVGNVSLEKMTDSSLIVQGAVKAQHVDAADLTASNAFLDHAFVNLIQGRMANFDQALIGGALLRDGAVTANKISVIPDTEDYAPNPGEYPDLWDLLGASLVANSNNINPSGVAFRFNQRSGDTQIRGPIRPVTPGRQIRFNGRYTYWGFPADVTANIGVRMEWFTDPDADRTGWSTITTVPLGSSAGWYEGTVTVPDDAIYGRLYLYQISTSGGDAGFMGTMTCEPMVGGELIVDGTIQGRHIVAESVAGAVAQFITLEAENVIATLLQASNAEFQDVVARVATLIELNASRITTGQLSAARMDIASLFADSAFINSLAARVIETLQVTAERGFIGGALLEDDTITVEKLYALDVIMSELGRFLKIEAGSLASNDIEAMRIVSSLIEATTYLIHNADGDVSVRLDGMDNYLAGRLHAGMNESEGIVLDWGEKVRYSGLTEEGDPAPDRTIRTPYLNFHTDDTSYLTGREPSIHLDRNDPSGRSGMMVINPGYPVGTDTFRGKLNVVGDVQSNRTEAREWSIARNGFNIPNNDPNLNATLSQESSTGNTYLLGRHHGASQSRARDSFWASDQYELDAGALRRRAFTWGAPPPTGQRSPILSVRLTQAASDRNAYVVANSSHHNATGYFINEHNPSNERATYYVYQLAVWEAV